MSEDAEPARRIAGFRRLAVPVAAGALVLLLGAVLAPRPPQLAEDRSGDAALLAVIEEELGSGVHDRVSVAVIDGDELRVAHAGADDDTEYEIGSVTKTFTGALLAEAVERGEVEQGTRLGELLDLGDSAAAEVTLLELATQSSGLPGLAPSPLAFLHAAVANLRGADPYATDLAGLIEQTRATPVGEKRWVYSNLGISLLGHALAAAAGTDYAALVEERVLDPLAMPATSAPDGVDELSPDAPTGFTASGRAAAPWTMAAYAPSGSIRSTTADMVRYARALLDGSAPGMEALDPRADADGMRIGYAWYATGEGVTWHNGMTGGFSAILLLDREADRAVVALSNTATPVDALGFRLIEGATP